VVFGNSGNNINAMSRNYKKLSLTIIRYLLGGLFLLSGIGKLIDTSNARYLVELLATKFYWLIEYAEPIVLGTSILELVFAVMLLWGRQLKAAFWGSLALVTAFTVTLGYFYLQGMSVENCGCFGALGIGGGLEATLIRNGLLLLLIAGGLWFIHLNTSSLTVDKVINKATAES
jgi:uncharacterized membrane protein YphA (DoxX/SURF4 family)